jgi:hypothetical protein
VISHEYALGAAPGARPFFLFASPRDIHYHTVHDLAGHTPRSGILAFQKKTFNPFPESRDSGISMPSPAAHALFGLTCLHLLRSVFPGSLSKLRTPTGLVLLASLAPDLDFLPGIWQGNPSRYHQALSHSLGMSFLTALVLGGSACLMDRSRHWWRWSLPALFFFLGHLFLDYFTEDVRPPIGFPLFWPCSARRFTSPIPIFPYLHRDPALPDFWSRNLNTLMVEALLLVPPWIVSRRLRPGGNK